LGIGSQGCTKRRDRFREMPLLKLRQAQIELDAGQFRIQGQRFSVGRSRLGEFLQPGKHNPPACESRSVAWIVNRYRLPSLGCLREFALLFQSLCIGRGWGLRAERQSREQCSEEPGCLPQGHGFRHRTAAFSGSRLAMRHKSFAAAFSLSLSCPILRA